MAKPISIIPKVLDVIDKDCQVIGVDIDLMTIKISIFSIQGSFINERIISSSRLLTPGTTIVQICECVQFLDPLKKVCCMGIYLPTESEIDYRVVKDIKSLPAWINVPLLDWLEIRLKRKVIILNLEEPILPQDLKDQWFNSFERVKINFRKSFIAAYIASQYFKDIDYSKSN